MKIICIIPARGGSKRIPNKNIVLLSGKPLIVHTIDHAKKSKLINRIIVSTDDNQIANISLKHGAEVIKRPSDISDDLSSSEDVLYYVLQFLERKEKYYPDLVVFLQCTSPFRNNNDIDNSINLLVDQNGDSLFSACRFRKFIWEKNNGNLEPINYDYKNRCREQDFSIQYQENGSIYVFKPSIFKLEKNRLFGKISVYEMTYLNSIQIDSFEDLYFCESILKQREKE